MRKDRNKEKTHFDPKRPTVSVPNMVLTGLLPCLFASIEVKRPGPACSLRLLATISSNRETR